MHLFHQDVKCQHNIIISFMIAVNAKSHLILIHQVASFALKCVVLFQLSQMEFPDNINK